VEPFADLPKRILSPLVLKVTVIVRALITVKAELEKLGRVWVLARASLSGAVGSLFVFGDNVYTYIGDTSSIELRPVGLSSKGVSVIE